MKGNKTEQRVHIGIKGKNILRIPHLNNLELNYFFTELSLSSLLLTQTGDSESWFVCSTTPPPPLYSPQTRRKLCLNVVKNKEGTDGRRRGSPRRRRARISRNSWRSLVHVGWKSIRDGSCVQSDASKSRRGPTKPGCLWISFLTDPAGGESTFFSSYYSRASFGLWTGVWKLTWRVFTCWKEWTWCTYECMQSDMSKSESQQTLLSFNFVFDWPGREFASLSSYYSKASFGLRTGVGK